MVGFTSRSARQLKIAAMIAAAPAVAVLLLFTFGEAFAGDLSGLSHLLQLLPLAAVLVGAWRFPRIGGAALVVLSLLLGALYPIAAGGERLGTVLLVELLFFAPPLVAGLLLLAAARANGDAPRHAHPG